RLAARSLHDALPISRFDADARAGMRMTICGLEEASAQVVDPDGREVAVLVDPAAQRAPLLAGADDDGHDDGSAAPGGCAGYWPADRKSTRLNSSHVS